MVKGIDVSSHQGVIDWDQAKKEVDYAILRAGWGNDSPGQDDEQFERNVAECERLGIPWGAYLYSYAMSTEEAESEAKHLLRLLEGKRPRYPVYLDMEDADGYKEKRGGLSRETATEICLCAGDRLEAAGYYFGIYASKDWLENRLDLSRLSRFDIWLAQWNDEPTYCGQFGMWQYTSEGRVSGIAGNVDMNRTTGYRDYPAYIGGKYEADKPEETAPIARYRPGDRVRVKGRLYASSDGSGAGKSVDGEYTVSRYLPGRQAAILIEDGLGWVREADCLPAGETVAPGVLREGARVRYTGRVYGDSYGGGAGKTVDGVYTVDRYLPDRACGVHLPAGWVPEAACTVVD
ncbi:MAG: hypothetical protein HFJ80_05265 [Clostridiales bacterium]|nr:hypothetical protein [Clostridiales bacterium]